MTTMEDMGPPEETDADDPLEDNEPQEAAKPRSRAYSTGVTRPAEAGGRGEPRENWTLVNTIDVLAFFILLAGIIGSIVLAVDLSEVQTCETVGGILSDRLSCETTNDAGTLIGVLVAGLAQTLVAVVLLMSVGQALRYLRRIADKP